MIRLMKKQILFISLVLTIFTINAQSKLSIGILSDYDSKDSLGLVLNKQILEEIEKVIGIDYDVVINDSLTKFCDWNSEVARQKYIELNDIADLIILVGPNSLNGSLKNKPFTKKTFALGVFNPQLQSIPATKEGTSGIVNFSYVTTKSSVRTELTNFKNDVAFNHLGILVDNKTKTTINLSLLDSFVAMMKDSLNCNITTHYIDANTIGTSISNLPDSIDAVFVGIPFEWNKKQASIAFEQLNQKKIPSLVMNDNYLRTGGLLSYSKNTSLEFI